MAEESISINISEYKGKKLDWMLSGSIKLEHLIGDCSGFSVGCVSMGGGWGNLFKSQKEFFEFMGKLLAHALVNQRLYKRFHHEDEPYQDKYDNKFVMTHSPDAFNRAGAPMCCFLQALEALSDREVATVDVNSWVGTEFQVKVVSVPKFLPFKKDLGLSFKDFKGTARYQGDNYPLLSAQDYETHKLRSNW